MDDDAVPTAWKGPRSDLLNQWPLFREFRKTEPFHRAYEPIFPSRTRTLKQTSSLVNAIKASKKEAGITARITPHSMRYAFSDLLRAADVDPITRRALVGHVTEQMQEHYSTVRLDEKRAAMIQASAKLEQLRGDDRGDKAGKREAA